MGFLLYFVENVTVLGSDDATTCHIVVLRNTGIDPYIGAIVMHH